MEKLYQEIIDRRVEPTRGDIANLLAEVGRPGNNREEKRALITRLFTDLGGGRNADGHHVIDTLEDWPEF